jgi:hypothetical protein
VLGTIYEWCYASVLGWNPLTTAYKTWTAKHPINSEFSFVEGEVLCPYGLIKIAFEQNDDYILLQVFVPTSTTGSLILPSEDSEVEIERQGSERHIAKVQQVSPKLGPYTCHIKVEVSVGGHMRNFELKETRLFR